MSESNTAAFFRAEGTLIKSGVLQAAAYMASQRAGMRERLLRFGQTALAAPVFGVLGQNDRALGNRVAHLSYRDISEDRVAVLAEEYVEDILNLLFADNSSDSGLGNSYFLGLNKSRSSEIHSP